jgi:predicted ester cyclase
MTDLTANKAVAVRFLDAVTAGDIGTLLSLITPDWQMTGGPPGLPRGAEGIHALFAAIGPIEQTWTFDDVIAEGDRVVVRATNTCVQDSFFGVPAAGIRQVFTATFTFRLDDGRIAETWRNADDLGRLLQLGARITAPN